MALLLFGIALLPYLQTWQHDFVDFDDRGYVSNNVHVQMGLTPANVGWAFSTFMTGNWHPLTWLSHMLDIDLWGSTAGGHHLTSALLHAVNSLLLFIVFWRMTGGLWRSALVAALFAVHPLHVESVAWVSERKDVLSTLFGLLALGAYVGYVRSRSAGQYLLTVICYALSLLSKQMWVTFPFLLLLLDIWPLRRWKLWQIESPAPLAALEVRSIRQILWEKAPFFALAAIFSGITFVAQREGQNIFGLDDFPLGSRIANAIVGYAAYLGKLVAPLKLAFFYPHPLHWSFLAVGFSGVVLLLVTTFALLRRDRSPWLLVGWLWFVGTLVPVIGLVQIGSQTIADRYTYLPSIGFFLMLVWSIPTEWAVRYPKATVAAAATLLALLSAKTWLQTSHWKDSRSLFSHAARVTRDNYMAHQNLGLLHEREGDLTGALALYRMAAAERPAYAKINAHENIASILIRQGRNTEARSELEAAIALNPKSSIAYNSLGSLMMLANENEKAATYLHRALELDPKNKGAQLNYGMTLALLGRSDEAIAQLTPIVRQEPERLLARTSLASAYAGRGDQERALEEISQILRIDPAFSLALELQEKIAAQKAKETSPIIP